VLGPIVCNQAGWVAAEVGRQPFAVYPKQTVEWDGGKAKVSTSYEGLRTDAGLSNRRVVTGPHVLGSILMFGFVYLLLFVVWVYVLNDKIQHGPDDSPAAPTTTSAEGLLDAATANKPAGGESLTQARTEALTTEGR
jgi:cytochrome bd ubiquinol oxidase subunit I